jgi:hypothetical protein
LEQFVDVFESTGDILVKKLSKESGNQSVDVFPYLTRCTLDIICGEINVLKSNNFNLKQFKCSTSLLRNCNGYKSRYTKQ